MAQLYKMTLYVCDLDDSLLLDEIETLIEQHALNGISMNCICHFADSKIGQNVEWNDDIDLNRCDCPTSTWDKYFAPLTKEKTNADRIWAMGEEELKEFICSILKCEFCKFERLGECEFLEWFKQPPEGE